MSDDPQQPKVTLSISGSVKQYITVEPVPSISLQGFDGEKIEQVATIKAAAEAQPFKITGITSNVDDKIKYKIKNIRDGQEYQLQVETRDGLKEHFKGKMFVTTDYQKKPKNEIVVSGRLQKEVQVSPEYVYFGIIDRNKESFDPKSLERTVLINSARGKDIKIEKIESPVGWVTTNIVTEKEGEQYKLIITLLKDQLPKETFREKINLRILSNKKAEESFIIIGGKVIN
jgi:hypothetical protein